MAKQVEESMVQQLKDMSEVSRSTEKKKLEVQLWLFSEQMNFLQDKDVHLNENAKAAQENARLAIEK